jgi:hypothetical protein
MVVESRRSILELLEMPSLHQAHLLHAVHYLGVAQNANDQYLIEWLRCGA